MFDHRVIADGLRMVNWSNYCHQTGVVKTVNGIPIFPLTAKAIPSETYSWSDIAPYWNKSLEHDLKKFQNVFEACDICHLVSILLKLFEEFSSGNLKR